jgi:hypothetical protein
MTKELMLSMILLFGSASAFAQTFQTSPDSIPFAAAISYGAGNSPFSSRPDGDSEMGLAVSVTDSDIVSVVVAPE